MKPPRRGAGDPSFQPPPPRARAPRRPPLATRSCRRPRPGALIANSSPTAAPPPRVWTAARDAPSPGTMAGLRPKGGLTLADPPPRGQASRFLFPFPAESETWTGAA